MGIKRLGVEEGRGIFSSVPPPAPLSLQVIFLWRELPERALRWYGQTRGKANGAPTVKGGRTLGFKKMQMKTTSADVNWCLLVAVRGSGASSLHYTRATVAYRKL